MNAAMRKSMAGRRGSVMIGVLVFAIIAAGIALVAVNGTLDSRHANQREESYSDGLAAAQYGAELAISEITNGFSLSPDAAGRTGGLSVVEGDWVLGADGGRTTLYAKGGVTDEEQRRIRGYFNNHEFRVRVRSARRGRDPAFDLMRDYAPDSLGMSYDIADPDKPLSSAWLFDPGEFEYGKDKLYSFRDAYEITATARPRDPAANPRLNSEPAVQAVIEYSYDSPLSTVMSGATLFMEKPENFQPLAMVTKVPDLDAPLPEFNPKRALKTVNNLAVSGEDHMINRKSNSHIINSAITTPMRLGSNEGKFFLAKGDYWRFGWMTVNAIDINPDNPDDALKYKEVEVTSPLGNTDGGASFTRMVKIPVPNPLRPFNYTGVPDLSAEDLGTLISSPDKKIPDSRAMWAASQNDDRTIDTYLLGGKPNQTVVYEPLSYASGYTVDSDSGKKAAGIITKQTNSSDIFTIVLGAFSDLPDLYINMAQGPDGASPTAPATWAQQYFGQYTKAQHAAKLDRRSAPILSRAGDFNKILPQTLHTVLNEQGEMLIREYEYTFKFGSGVNAIEETLYFPYPAGDRDINYALPLLPIDYFEHTETGEIAFGSVAPGDTPEKQAAWGSKKTLNWKAEWKGNYTWANAQYGNVAAGKYGYLLADQVIREHVFDGAEGTSKAIPLTTYGYDVGICVPRQFFWQELVGYSLVKDYSTADRTVTNSYGQTTIFHETYRYGEPLLVADGLGFPEASKGETHENGLSSSRRPIPYEDENGERVSVGFDEAYQRNPMFNPSNALYDPENAGRWASYFPPGVSAFNNNYTAGPSYLVDAQDTIYVRNESGGLDAKTSMNDFLVSKTFIKDPGLPTEEEITRDAVGIFICFEDQVEWTADYNYDDMVFSMYVAPPIEETVTPEVNVAANPKHWWERDEVDGLTGDESFAAVGVNMQPDTSYGQKGWLSDAELREEHFRRFRPASGSDAGIIADGSWTMHGNETDKTIDFPRAVFRRDAGGTGNTGVLDTDSEVVKRFLKLAEEENKPKTFYFTKDDLVDYIQMFVGGGDPAQTAKWYDTATRDWKYDLAAAEIKARNTGFILEPIAKRWEDRDGASNLRTERAALTKTATDERGAMTVSREPKLLRQLAAGIIGSSVETVPVVRTDGFRPVPGAVAQRERLGFIAGELRLVQDPGYDMAAEGIRSDGQGVPIRPDALTFPEPDARGDFRTDYAKAYFAEAPFNMENQADMDAAAQDAVAMAYREFYDPATKQDMQGKYSIKEHRYSLGHHRSGKAFNANDPYAQDRMEIVGLGVKGFNPFRTTDGGVSLIAGELSGAPADPVHAVVPNYPTNEDAEGVYGKAPVTPTFVFDRPIDGAGALVVNGNLHIKSTFAYYGILVVLGDLIVEPSLHEGEFVCNSEGHAMDMYGNAIFPDGVVSFPYVSGSVNWSYDNPNTGEDEEALLVGGGKQMMTVIEPSVQDIHRGALILQGSVAVKGRVVTKKTTDSLGGAYAGIFNAYWNKEAVEDAGGVIAGGKPAVRRLVWTSARQGGLNPGYRGAYIPEVDIDNIWLDRTDKGNSTYMAPDNSPYVP